MESTYEEIQASVFCNKIRKMERTIDNNLDEIEFENLSVEQFETMELLLSTIIMCVSLGINRF